MPEISTTDFRIHAISCIIAHYFSRCIATADVVGFFSETSGVAVGRLLERVYVIFFAKQKLHKHLPCTQNQLRRKRRIWTHFAVTLLCAPEKYHIQTYLAQDI